MRAVKAAVTSSLLLLAACSQSQQSPELQGIVQLTCYGGNTYDQIYIDDLIVDTENWELLEYVVETDSLKERTITPYFMKGMEASWKLEKTENLLTITRLAKYSEEYLLDRAKKREMYLARNQHALENAIRDLGPYDRFTENRRKDKVFTRLKIDTRSLKVDLFENDASEFSQNREVNSVTGSCDVTDPPTTTIQ
jgi:hypothetical protein